MKNTKQYFILYEVYCNGRLITKASLDVAIDSQTDDPSMLIANVHSYICDKVRAEGLDTEFSVLILNIINLNTLFNI